MKPSLRRAFVLPGLLAASAVPLLAHPGHDGDHELTWELGHLVQHPLATLGCVAVLAATIWAGMRFFRRPVELAAQSLRGSQPSRGK